MPSNEIRATQVLRAFAETYESAYKYYLKCFWEGLRVFSGKKVIKQSQGFAGLLELLIEHLPEKFQQLIIEDAAFIRNAIQHVTWNYDSENDEIILWDSKGNVKYYCIDCLMSLTNEMYELSEILLIRFQQYFLFKIMSEPNYRESLKLSMEIIKKEGYKNVPDSKFIEVEKLMLKSAESLKDFTFPNKNRK